MASKIDEGCCSWLLTSSSQDWLQMSSVKVLLIVQCLAAKLPVLVKLLFGADREAWWHAASKKQEKQQQAAPVHNEFVDEEVHLTLQCCVPSHKKHEEHVLPHAAMESVCCLHH